VQNNKKKPKADSTVKAGMNAESRAAEAWAFFCRGKSISSFSITLPAILLKTMQLQLYESGWYLPGKQIDKYGRYRSNF
jgi:hypothetical protein